jgi:prepilin-type N-terminal cleavage/methylation domain-containing protein
MLSAGAQRLCRRAMTLVELLVVVVIIGMLLSLLLPAVQAARESGRQSQCRNNLKQLSLAMQSHLAALGRYPTNGWGYNKYGDPDQATDEKQPGGWIYCILPYIDQQNLRDVGRGLTPEQKPVEMLKMMQTPLALLRCPTRPVPRLSPSRPFVVYDHTNVDPLAPPDPLDSGALVAKTDYAVNEGDCFVKTSPVGAGDTSYADQMTGICFQRSKVTAAMVRDGLSQTYMLGEKWLSDAFYSDFSDLGNDQSMYCGDCVDIGRWAMAPPLEDKRETWY